jgi:hypothetical protein
VVLARAEFEAAFAELLRNLMDVAAGKASAAIKGSSG